jgi:hypothetical protein
MRRVLGLVLAAALAIGVVAAVGMSLLGKSKPSAPANLTTVRGVIGSEKQPFFSDAQVIAEFHKQGYDVQVDTAGSRQIATSIDLSKYDFAFPAGSPAAEKIRLAKKINKSYVPFYTPMVVASFKEIALLLQAAGAAQAQGNGTYYTLDVSKYLQLVKSNTRWSDLPNNTSYATSKSILITSTDVRTSNSAAMYLAIASYVANSDNIVQDATQAAAVLPTVEPLFLRQGFTEQSSEGPFTDYLSIGIGKTPLVMIYESQFVARAAARDGSITHDMVLMYPTPTVYSKHTVVPLTANGDAVGKLLLNDVTLQHLAVKYGFRTNDPGYFAQFASSHGVSLPPGLVNVIDPPTYEVLEGMITDIEKRLTS